MNAFRLDAMRKASTSVVLVTASAATTTATAVAATTTAATTTTATTAPAGFARSGFVDGQRAPIVLSAVDAGNGRLGFLVATHFDEAETFASARVAVHDDLGTLYRPEFTKNLVEI
jgi:hypothetical protein